MSKLTPEREKEIRYYHAKADELTYGNVVIELLAELDRVRADLAVAVEALDWITNWGDIHDVHGRKAYEAITKIRGDK